MAVNVYSVEAYNCILRMIYSSRFALKKCMIKSNAWFNSRGGDGELFLCMQVPGTSSLNFLHFLTL